MTIFLAALAVVLTVLLGISVYLMIKLGQRVLELEEQVEQSLDVLDASYRSINSILEIPVMSDEPFVRRVLSDIENAQEALLLVANKISVFNPEEDEEQEKGGE